MRKYRENGDENADGRNGEACRSVAHEKYNGSAENDAACNKLALVGYRLSGLDDRYLAK